MALNRFGYRLECVRYTPHQLLQADHLRQLEFNDLVCRYMVEHGRTLGFIQVGAYDGVSTDPLRKYIVKHGWRGVLVEPQPGPAEKLRELYRDNPGIIIIEAAVDDSCHHRTLFVTDSNDAPSWIGGMASFGREHIVKHESLVPGLTGKIREILVDCLPFSDVIRRLPCKQLDLLQIDAEGADGHLLSMFPFEKYLPPIVHWEKKNLSRDEQERTLAHLAQFGYRFAPSGEEDILATLL